MPRNILEQWCYVLYSNVSKWMMSFDGDSQCACEGGPWCTQHNLHFLFQIKTSLLLT